jgi:mannose-6-phosphate isomerase-like protein (cupin superfamily)
MVQGPFIRWDEVDEWTGTGADSGWRGRRLVFEGTWTLHMVCDEGYHWAHSHPQSQIVWLVRGELLAKIGDPEQPEAVQEQVIRPGDLLLIPGNTHHDMTALTEIEAWEVRGMEGPDRWEEFCIRTGG